MAWEQVKPFIPNEMGKQKGWCLKNVRLGYRVYTAKYASAKSAMQAGIKNGTVHPYSEMPTNVAVPVYIKTTSVYGHVVVCDKGKWYTDGKTMNKPLGGNVLGWDEMADGTRVVQWSNNRSFLPAKGFWGPGDKDERIAILARFMRANFPAYTSAKALGPEYGPNLQKAIVQFQKRQNRVPALYPVGYVGPKTYEALKKYGFDY